VQRVLRIAGEEALHHTTPDARRELGALGDDTIEERVRQRHRRAPRLELAYEGGIDQVGQRAFRPALTPGSDDRCYAIHPSDRSASEGSILSARRVGDTHASNPIASATSTPAASATPRPDPASGGV
jgi:hypothetical protein